MEQLTPVITYSEIVDFHNQQLLAIIPDAAGVIAATHLTAKSTPEDFARAVAAERERKKLLARNLPGAEPLEVALYCEELSDIQEATVCSRGLWYLRQQHRRTAS